MDSVTVKFGKRLKQLRKQNNLSQEQLSFKTGLHRNYICDVERGNRNISIEAIQKLANGLNVDITELFKFEEK